MSDAPGHEITGTTGYSGGTQKALYLTCSCGQWAESMIWRADEDAATPLQELADLALEHVSTALRAARQDARS